MDYRFQEPIKELIDSLTQTRLPKTNGQIDHAAKEADILWDASRFLALVIEQKNWVL